MVFALLLGVAPVAAERVTHRGVRYLAYLPACLFLALVVGSAAAEVGSLPGGLFTFTRLAVLGVAAYTCERSWSLPLPAIAYLGLSLADSAVVVLETDGILSIPVLPLPF